MPLGWTKLFPVSIHAPVKGATPAVSERLSIIPCFNSRSREGSDIEVARTLPGTISFQFTLP